MIFLLDINDSKLNQKSTKNATAFTKHANDKANNFVRAKAEESVDDSSGFVVGDVLGVEVGNVSTIGDVVGVEVGDVLVLGDVLGADVGTSRGNAIGRGVDVLVLGVVLGADVGTPKGNALGRDVIESGTTVEGDDVDILSTCSVIQSCAEATRANTPGNVSLPHSKPQLTIPI